MAPRPCSKRLRLEKDYDAATEGEEVTNDALELELAVDGSHQTRELADNRFLYGGIQPPPPVKIDEPRVIFVFEKASLVPAVVGRKNEILNSDIHADYLRKKKLNPADYRPDIIHEVLVNLLGRRLNLSGRIQKVFIRTDEGLLIKIHPSTHIPETVLKFGLLFSQMFRKLSIKSKASKDKKIIELVQNPLSKHLPANSLIIGLSRTGKKVTSVGDYLRTVNMNQTLVFVVGAMAHGKFDDDYTDDLIAVSDMPMTAAKCVGDICYELERRWKVL